MCISHAYTHTLSLVGRELKADFNLRLPQYSLQRMNKSIMCDLKPQKLNVCAKINTVFRRESPIKNQKMSA